MRFNAVDGRCKDDECKIKKKELEKKYKVKINNKTQPPTASLVLGTIQILKEQVRNKWKHVLICEDDIVFERNMVKRFSKGIENLPEDWDLLYLGCGNQGGHRGISTKKNKTSKYKTSLSIVSKDYNWYVNHRDDLRTPCDEEDCPAVDDSKFLSYPSAPGGTWAYAYSLNGAKKFLKFLNDKVTNHVDQLLIQAIQKGKLEAISFDPPIIMHEKGALRPDSDILWSWDD
jgi:hypothetical protein